MTEQRIRVNQEQGERQIPVAQQASERSICVGGEPSVLHGIDGVSPIATVTQTEDGAVISITDRDGTTTAEIHNGEQGPQGEAATIAVGTVTTGAPGTSATVTNSGTSTDAVLNFTIPRGDKGEDGSGSGDMLASTYDPNGTVASAGGIVDYVGTITPELVEMSYGESNAWAKFIAAYQAHSIVYCRASSAANPASGSQTRKAFMAYVNNAESPTQVEFQYYRSVSSHTDAQQGDQVFIYLLTNASGGTWSVTTRNTFSKVVAGTNMSSSYSNGVLTLNCTVADGTEESY